MPVNSIQYKASVGVFNNRDNNSKTKYLNYATILSVLYMFNFPKLYDLIYFFKLLFQVALQLCFFFVKHIDEPLGTNLLYSYVTITYLHFLWYHKQRLILSNDIEVNPGPKLDSSQNFTICHWNLNSIAAHTFSKINFLKAYLTIHKTDIVCLSETYLDSSFLVNDENLVTQGYNLVRCNHPTNSKHGGVCVYYKESLPLKIIDIQYLQECVNVHLIIGDKLCHFITLY